jgi:hypothetical protein
MLEPRQVHAEHVAIQKEEGAANPVLGRGCDLVLYGERRQEGRDLGGTHVDGVAFAVEEDEPPNPMDVGLLGPPAVMPGAYGLADPVEESGRACGWTSFAHEPRCGGRRPVEKTADSFLAHDASIIGPEAKSLQGVPAPIRSDFNRRRQPRPLQADSESEVGPSVNYAVGVLAPIAEVVDDRRSC